MRLIWEIFYKDHHYKWVTFNYSELSRTQTQHKHSHTSICKRFPQVSTLVLLVSASTLTKLSYIYTYWHAEREEERETCPLHSEDDVGGFTDILKRVIFTLLLFIYEVKNTHTHKSEESLSQQDNDRTLNIISHYQWLLRLSRQQDHHSLLQSITHI